MSIHSHLQQTGGTQAMPRRRLLPIMQAVLITCGAVALYTAAPEVVVAQTVAVQQYTIPGGPLAPALRSLASTAGVAIIFTEEQTAGKTTAGVSGNLSVQEAFAALLADTGLRLVVRDNGGYGLAPVLTSAGIGASSTRTLAAVNVNARRELNGTTEGSDSYTSRVTSIASKTDQSFREIPQSVSVVTRQQMDDQRIGTVAAAMEAMPGITSARMNAYTSDFYSRGFKITSMQIDGGAPLALGSYTYAPLQDMGFYDRVELMRGASGLLGGTGDPGGIINIARKKPLAERQVTVEGVVDSFGGYKGMVDASSPFNAAGTLRGRGVVTYADQQTFRDNQQSRIPAVYGVLEADLTKDTLLTAGGSYSKHKMTGTGGGISRTFDGHDLGFSRSTNLTQPWDKVNYETKEVFAQLEHQFANRWKLKLNVTHTESAVDATTSFVNGNFQHNGTGGSWWGGNYDYGNKQDLVDVNVAGPFNFMGRTHEFLIGADWQRVQSHWKSGLYPDRGTVPYVAGGPITPWTPDFSTPFNETYSPWGQKQVGAYSVLRLHPTDRLHIIAGARVSRYNFDQLITYDIPGGPVEEAAYFKTATKTTPYGGVIYDFTPQWSGYASYASIFKPQSLLLSGPPTAGTSLPPIEGKAYEAGIKGELMDGRLNATVSLFNVQRTGTGIYDDSYSGSFNAWGGSCCYLPQGKVTSQGIDTEIGGEVLPGLQMAAGYTYNHTKDETKGTVFSPVTPKHILKMSTMWTLPGQWQQWKVGGSARIQSSAAASNSVWDGTKTTVYPFEQGGYAVFNAIVQYKIDPTWTVSLNVNNLFDKWYYDSLDSRSWYGAPRNASLALRGSF